MATHSSILAWRIPWTEEPGGYSPWGSQRVRHDWRDSRQHNLPPYFGIYFTQFLNHEDMLVVVAQSCPLFATTWTVTCWAPLSMGFSRQEYWSGLPCPSPGDLPDQDRYLSVLHLPEAAFQMLLRRSCLKVCLNSLANSLENTLKLGETEGRRSGQQSMRWLDGITDSMAWVWAHSGRCEGQGSLACCSPWGHKEPGTT